MTTSGHRKPLSRQDVSDLLRRGYDALKKHQYNEAATCCSLILKAAPKTKAAHFLVGLVAIETRNYPMAEKAFKSVLSLDETSTAAWAQLARSFIHLGQYANAGTALDKAVALGTDDPMVEDVIGTVFSHLGNETAALDWYDRANGRTQSNMFELSRAKSLIFLGRIAEAKSALEAVLEERPDVAQAHWMLARAHTAEDTRHINTMEQLVTEVAPSSNAAAFLWYAIGKEHEDQGAWDAAFDAYDKGASARRGRIVYDEAKEERLYGALKDSFTPTWLKSAGQGHDSDAPIFIIGQPRTGTTLVERIITAHSMVHSAGELQQFGMAIKRMVGMTKPGVISPDAVSAAATLDMDTLGRLYLETSRTLRGDAPRFVDKMPVNYLYAPLIAAALPSAKIIHLTRDPVDSCFASYKQLFADAYFHSYDQAEMARHYCRYRDLMDHYEGLLGGRILTVAYEDTVCDVEGQARRIIDHLGLGWEDACAEFHKQEGAVTTASAAQVREKAHTRSVGRWKHFEKQLGTMTSVLKERGFA